jgi:hypothetical protein
VTTPNPAEDCGVAAGCGSCPLGRAGICGDPGTQIPAGFGLVAAYALAAVADTEAPDAPDDEEPKPEGVDCCGGGCSA